MKKPKKKLSVSIEPKINRLLDVCGFNKSKLINKLLIGYFKKHSDIHSKEKDNSKK